MKRRNAFLFLVMLVLMAMISGGAASSSSSYLVFNVQWLLWAYTMAVFGFAGYSFLIILKAGIKPVKTKRKAKGGRNILMLLVNFLSFVVIIFLFMKLHPTKKPTGNNTSATAINLHQFTIPLSKMGIIIKNAPINMTLYLLPYVVLFFFIILGLLLFRKRRMEVEEIARRFNPELTYDSLEGTPAERVIKMYKNVVAGLVRKGYPYQKSWTHWEHEDRLREIFPDLEDLDTLTRLFEKARYAERLSPGDVNTAKESYDRIMEFLR